MSRNDNFHQYNYGSWGIWPDLFENSNNKELKNQV